MVQTSWGLVIEESWAELTHTSQQYGRWLLLLLVVGALVPAVVIGVGARQVTQPIARLASAAREMAGGKLDQVITVRTGDELEELAAQFNRMSAQLRVSYADLEQRVANRTRELTTLNGIAADVSRSLDLDDVFSAALARTLETTGMEVGLAYCLEDDGETLALIAHRGLAEESVRDVIRLPLGASAAGRANRGDYPVVLEVADYPESSLKALLQAEGLQMAISIPLTVKGRIVGAVNLGSLTVRDVPPEELSLLAAIGQQMGVAVENAQLYEQAEESAVVAERNRLARDLHDAVTQTLFSASLIAEVLPRLMERKPDEGRRRLAELRELTRGALAEMRTLLLELRPSALVEVELGSLLQQLAESITGRARVPVVVKMEGECVVPADVKVALYRIAQEALNNVAKHAGASEASVRVRCQAEQVTLQISDDGRGFGPADVSAQSLGVGIMRERAKAIGAELEIKSKPEQGTRVVVVWPRVQDQARKPYQ
jgi:two-component system nitrate/nitrite sensor histidine kinase NarX